MADPISLAAGAIAVIQVADRVLGLCRSYIDAFQNAPRDLHAILTETAALKSIFQQLLSFNNEDAVPSPMLKHLLDNDGPVHRCRACVAELEVQLGSERLNIGQDGQAKRRKIKPTLTSLAWPMKEGKVKRILDEMLRHKATIDLALSSEATLDIKKVYATLSDTKRFELYKWFLHTDPSPIHNSMYKLYEAETGDWLFRSQDWEDWLQGRHRCVWIHGIPGAGKTVLASHLIQYLGGVCKSRNTQRVTCVYYYCNYRNNQDEAEPLIRWMLNQLCRQVDKIPASVYDLFKCGRQPNLSDLKTGLKHVLEDLGTVFLIIDAVDESNPREALLELLDDFMKEESYSKIQLLATSREYLDIKQIMLGISRPVSMNNPSVQKDIKKFVNRVLRHDKKFRLWTPALIDEVNEALATGAKGMFRWAVCQLDILRRLRRESDIRAAIQSLPETLDDTYIRIFSHIGKEDWQFVRHILRWILYHEVVGLRQEITSPILLASFAGCASGPTSPGPVQFYDSQEIQDICGCLITCKEQAGNDVSVTLAHYTVREFLESIRIEEGPVGFFAARNDTFGDILRATLEQAVVTTVDYGDYPTGRMWLDRWRGFHHYSLYSSAISFYRRPLSRTILEDDTLVDLLQRFLDPTQPHFMILTHGTPAEIPSNAVFWPEGWLRVPTCTAAASIAHLLLAGQLELAERMLSRRNTKEILQATIGFWYSVTNDSRSELSAPSTYWGTILDVFTQRYLVMDDGRDLFRHIFDFGRRFLDPSQLLLSVIGSHHHTKDGCQGIYQECIIATLLQDGADPNTCSCWATPLQIAVFHSDKEGVLALARAGANPNSTGDDEATPWVKGTFQSSFNDLHDWSPLDISRSIALDEARYRPMRKQRREPRAMVERLLIEYGAEEYGGCPDTPKP